MTESTAYAADAVNEQSAMKERIATFLRQNAPQIQMHGGQAAITNLNLAEGSVTIKLGGACDGCGLSPMTTQAIQQRLVKEIDEIMSVRVLTGEL